MPDNNLTEVLAVSVDTAEFQRGLEQLKTMWASFVSEVGSGNIDSIFSTTAFSGLVSGITELKDSFAQISTEAYQSVQNIAEAINTALGRIETAQREAADSTARSRNGKGGYNDQEEQDKFASEQDSARLKASEKAEAQLEKEYQAYLSNIAKIEAADESWAAKKEIAQDKAYAASVAADEKEYQAYLTKTEKLVAADEAWEVKREITQDKAYTVSVSKDEREYQAYLEKTAKLIEADEAWEVKRELSQDRAYAASVERDEREYQAYLAKTQRLIQADEEWEIKRETDQDKAYQSSLARMDALHARALAENDTRDSRRTRSSSEQIDQAHEQALKEEEKRNNSPVRGSSLGENIGRLAVLAVEWQAVSAAINGVMAAATAPFRAIADGVKYLGDTERISEQISGVLVSTVKYSEDFAENLQTAREAAAGVARSLQDMGARDNIKPDTLQTTFQNVAEAGAGRGTNNTQQMLEETELFATAFKTLGLNARTARAEIYGALNGTPTAGSKFLELIRMSADEWVKARDAAYENGTIVELLASRLQPYVDAAKRSSESTSSLQEQILLLKERLEAVIGVPFSEWYNALLKGILAWADKNQEVIGQWVNSLQQVVIATISIADQFVTVGKAIATSDGLATQMFENFAVGAKKMAEVFGMIMIASAQLQSPESLGFVKSTSLTDDQKKKQPHGVPDDIYLSDINDKQGAEYKTKAMAALFGKEILALAKDSGKFPSLNVEKGTAFAPGWGTSPIGVEGIEAAIKQALEAATKPGPKPPNTDKPKKAPSELPDTMVEFSGEMEGLQGKKKQFLAEQKQAVASNAKDQSQVDEENIAYLKKEDEAVQSLVARYKILVQTRGDSKTPQGQQKIKTDVDRLTNTGKKSSDNLQDEQNTFTLKDTQEDQKDKVKTNKEELDEIQRNLTTHLEAAKQLRKENFISEEQMLEQESAAELAAYNARQVIYDREIQETGENTKARETAVNKLKSADEEYTAWAERNANDRAEAHRKELDAQAAYTREISALREQHSDVTSEIESTFPGNVKSTAQFSGKARQIEDEIRLKDALLAQADAAGKDADAVRKLETELAKLSVDRITNLRAQLAAIQNNGGTQFGQQVASRAAVNKAITGAEGDEKAANQRLAQGAIGGADAQTMRNLSTQAQAAADALNNLKQIASSQPGGADGKDTSSNKTNAIDAILGSGFSAKWADAGKAGDSFASSINEAGVAAGGFSNALKGALDIANEVMQGMKKGGVIGGIGAGLSNSTVDGALNAIMPGAGAIAGAVGGVMSMIGGLFTAATQRMAGDIKNEITSIGNAFNNQTATLSQTIQSLQAEEQRAISTLSGMKGGQDQLNQILPGLQQQIAQLELQAKQLVLQFSQASTALGLQLQLQGDALSSVYNQWVQINKQVNDYVNAGGTAAQAAEYLSAQLQLIAQQSQQTLTQGDQQAVQDAINLNNLLLQRQQLVQSLNTQAFALQNQDATERTQAGSVTRAEQLKLLEQGSQQQLADLNYAINTAQIKVDAESKVFDLAKSTADLHKQDDKDTLAGLDLQLQKYTALQALVASITQNANGLFSSSLSFLQPVTNPVTGQTINIGTININTPPAAAGTDATAYGQATADALMAEIQRSARSSAYAG